MHPTPKRRLPSHRARAHATLPTAAVVDGGGADGPREVVRATLTRPSPCAIWPAQAGRSWCETQPERKRRVYHVARAMAALRRALSRAVNDPSPPPPLHHCLSESHRGPCDVWMCADRQWRHALYDYNTRHATSTARPIAVPQHRRWTCSATCSACTGPIDRVGTFPPDRGRTTASGARPGTRGVQTFHPLDAEQRSHVRFQLLKMCLLYGYMIRAASAPGCPGGVAD